MLQGDVRELQIDIILLFLRLVEFEILTSLTHHFSVPSLIGDSLVNMAG